MLITVDGIVEKSKTIRQLLRGDGKHVMNVIARRNEIAILHHYVPKASLGWLKPAKERFLALFICRKTRLIQHLGEIELRAFETSKYVAIPMGAPAGNVK